MTLKINDHSAESDGNESYMDAEIAKVDSYMAVDSKVVSESAISPDFIKSNSSKVIAVSNEDKAEKPIIDTGLANQELGKESIHAPEVLQKKPKRKLNPSPKKKVTVTLAILAIMIISVGTVIWYSQKSRTPGLTKNSPVNTKKIEAYKIAPTFVEGIVEYSTDSKVWQPLTDKITLRQNNIVRTGKDSRVVLSIDDGSILRLDHDSAVKFTKLATTDIKIQNLYGNVYNRVATSVKRKYTMLVNETSFQAMGTAFSIINRDEVKGVNVYQSKVRTAGIEVGQGQAYYIKSTNQNSINTVQTFDVAAANNDQFVQWNVEQDIKIKDFASKLGVLAEPAIGSMEPVAPAPVGEIKLAGTVSNYALNVTWQTENFEAAKGFKVVYSSKTTLPVYGVNSSEHVSNPSVRKATILPPDGRTYSVRVCAYDGKSCGIYSNVIKLTVPAKPTETVSIAPMQSTTKLSLSGTVLTWTIAGTAPNGYKVVASTSKTNPEYPADGYIVYLSNEETKTADIAGKLETGIWSIRVCKYTGSSCIDYSNTVTYTKP